MPSTSLMPHFAQKLVEGLDGICTQGSEAVRVVLPDAAIITWDPDLVTPADNDRLNVASRRIRSDLCQLDVLHRMPQVILMLHSGAAMELFGFRTGMAEVSLYAGAR